MNIHAKIILMNKLYLPNYNLDITLLGGQSFNWDFINGYYFGFTVDKVIKLKYEKDYLYWQTYPKKDDFDFIKKYFRVEFPYTEVIENLKIDKHLISAINKYQDLRILQQDFEQTLISYIISANKNIKSIRVCVRLLAEKFGEKLILENETFHLFPKPEILANLSIDQIKESRVGFRAKYIKSAAEKLTTSNLKLSTLNEADARTELLKFNGIGNKIADCILLYALKHDNVTAFDVWGKRVFTELYQLDEKLNYEEMRKWSQEYFKGHAGLAGQFLFEYIRNLKPVK
jgi:N-glycosylase/DNA lyase